MYNRKRPPLLRIFTLFLALCTACFGLPALCEDAAPFDADAWAKALFDSAIGKLVDAGDLSFQFEDYRLPFHSQPDGYTVAFADDQTALRYTASPFEIDGKVILCVFHANRDDPFSVYEREGEPNPEEPHFLPTYLGGGTIFTDIAPQRFASHVDECAYLLIYGGFEAARSEKFYMGGMDRVSTTTLVLIIDVQQQQLVHIEHIGTDTPAAMRTTYTTGKALYDEAQQYLITLLGDAAL